MIVVLSVQIASVFLHCNFLTFSQDSKAYYHLLEQVAPKGDEEGIPAVVIDMSGLRVRLCQCLQWTPCSRCGLLLWVPLAPALLKCLLNY